jgi:hypothetical protein
MRRGRARPVRLAANERDCYLVAERAVLGDSSQYHLRRQKGDNQYGKSDSDLCGPMAAR